MAAFGVHFGSTSACLAVFKVFKQIFISVDGECNFPSAMPRLSLKKSIEYCLIFFCIDNSEPPWRRAFKIYTRKVWFLTVRPLKNRNRGPSFQEPDIFLLLSIRCH